MPLFTRLLDVLYPPACVLCAQAGADGRPLCRACAADLPWLGRGCRLCAHPLPATAPDVCGRCLRHSPAYGAVFAPLLYAEPVDRLIADFKFHGRVALAPLLAGLMIEAAARAGRRPVGTLLPVPLHPSRLRERGYNQALELARPLARHFGLPLQARLLRRTRPTTAQMTLPARYRAGNVRGAFALHGRARPPEAVVLVDDVLTTGATVNELASLLLRAGTRRVEVWALARAVQAR